MPPQLALALTLVLIAYLLRRDWREEPRVSNAVWIPIIWLMINGSRQVSQWLEGRVWLSGQALSEGNPIDQTVYAALMLAGVLVLASRRVAVGQIVSNNLPIILLLLWGAVSVLWSEFPLTAMKRWIKALGDPIMVLVLWSDRFPARAINSTIRRCAYILIPLSLLFCKYYEHLGRAMDSWGRSSYTGVTGDKNMFGYLLFAFGLYFAAALMSGWRLRRHERGYKRTDQIINVLLLAMIVWLIPIANSKTSTVALTAGVACIVALQFRMVRRRLLLFALASILLVTVADALLSVKSLAIEATGRDATFTGRTGLWETVLKEPINPLIGAGYGSFWLGERLARFWEMYPTSPPIQAHNGYLEVYLNLGIFGLCLLALLLWRGLRTAQTRATVSLSLSAPSSRNEHTLAIFGLAYAVSYLLYNVTEATFQGMNFLFTLFLILAFRSPSKRSMSNGAVVAEASRWRERLPVGRTGGLR